VTGSVEEAGEKTVEKAGQEVAQKEWEHTALNVAGCIPGMGNLTTGINGVIYLTEGRLLEASLSAISMVPVVGSLAKASILAGKTILEKVAEKLAKVAGEEVVETVVKDVSEEIVEDVTKEVAEQTVKQTLKEAGEELFEAAAESLQTTETILGEPEETLAENETSEQVNDEIPQLINSLTEQYGEETVETFLPLCEKYNVNLADLLTNPPSEGQSPIGWVLGIENPANPVNQPLLNLNLSADDIKNILTQSTHNPDSNVVVLGYGKGADTPYYKLGEEIQGSYLSLPDEAWAPFEDAPANFWTDVNKPFLEQSIDERKILLFNINKTTITDPLNAGRFSLPELKLIELPSNNYVRVELEHYELFVPQELQETYLEQLPAQLLGEL